MAKNILAFFGLLFLTLIILAGILVVGVFYDKLGFVSLPKGLVETSMSFLTPGPLSVAVQGVGQAEWSNPLDALPIATQIATPEPTATPIPPMEPEAYRAAVISRMRSFADAMNRWLEANNQLAKNNALMQDTAWAANMQVVLDDVATSGDALAAVGPAPSAYQTIDSWLKKIRPEADGLKENYQKALAKQDTQSFVDASGHFNAIKEDLTQAVNDMIKAGWTLQ